MGSNFAISILDGGMGRQLERIGAPFRQPEWSALSLILKPDFVTQVHLDFINAGANIITTNSYALVPFHIGAKRFKQEAPKLLERAVDAALNARKRSHQSIKIAGGVPPMFGSYQPQKFDPITAIKMLEVFREKLVPRCDLIIAETMSSMAEIHAFQKVFETCHKPTWISITLNDNETTNLELRSGELLKKIIPLIKPKPFDGLLFNCSQPEVMEKAIQLAVNLIGPQIPIGVYANAFAPLSHSSQKANKILNKIRGDLTPEHYKNFAIKWVQAGASIVGGCCGIGPEHILALSKMEIEF